MGWVRERQEERERDRREEKWVIGKEGQEERERVGLERGRRKGRG